MARRSRNKARNRKPDFDRPKRVPTPPFPRSVEKRYRIYLARRVKALDRLVKAHVLKALDTGKSTGKIRVPDTVRNDGVVEDLLARLGKAFAAQAPPDPDFLARLATQVDASAKGFQASLVVGVVPIKVPFNPKKFIAANVDLITSIDAVYLGRVAELIAEAQAKGWSAARAGKELQKATGITQRRAQLIARDQIASVNSQIAKKRQTDVGITSYTWSTSQDERVRPTHAAREGKAFDWDSPPPDGHPGEPINCRCVAIPVFK